MFNHEDDQMLMVRGGNAVITSGIAIGAIKLSGVALVAAPMTITTAVAGGVPVVSTVALSTFWGGAIVGAKVSLVIGAGCFLFGFGRGLIRGYKEGMAAAK